MTSTLLDDLVTLRTEHAQAFLGIDIRPALHAPIGTPIVIDGRVFMHPLDVLYLTRPDPIEHLEIAMNWITQRAHARLDAITTSLETEPHESAQRSPKSPTSKGSSALAASRDTPM